uniref:Uncharacterized protein n=1 Tax=Pyxicephalus adspersus TaxID=30357 RepID=A0AAV2ZK05_PYXAD|nr:TPA: hypothetical protein GDO54_004773 [Pyxicephalus adspersus]
MRQAWWNGPMDFDGAPVQLLLDLSSHTFRMRLVLRPLLDGIRMTQASYRWGSRFHLLVTRNYSNFALQRHSQLPGLFEFLQLPPIEIPDWLKVPLEVPSESTRSSRPRSTQGRQWASRTGPLLRPQAGPNEA